MQSPHALGLVENRAGSKIRSDGFFCGLSRQTIAAFDAIKVSTAFPRGAVLFVEGQHPRSALVVCRGRVKLSAVATDEKAIITKTVGPGSVLGLSAVISGQPYLVTAETLEPCQISFVKRPAFIDFVREHRDAFLWVVLQLSNRYSSIFT